MIELEIAAAEAITETKSNNQTSQNSYETEKRFHVLGNGRVGGQSINSANHGKQAASVH